MKYISLFILFNLIILASQAQSFSEKFGNATVALQIDKENKSIDLDQSLKENHDSFKKKESQITLLGFYQPKNTLVKIISTKAKKDMETSFSYYFQQDSLTHILETHKTDNQIDFTGYYFFQKNKLIYIETTGHNRFENDKLDPEKILLEEAYSIQKEEKKLNKIKL